MARSPQKILQVNKLNVRHVSGSLWVFQLKKRNSLFFDFCVKDAEMQHLVHLSRDMSVCLIIATKFTIEISEVSRVPFLKSAPKMGFALFYAATWSLAKSDLCCKMKFAQHFPCIVCVANPGNIQKRGEKMQLFLCSGVSWRKQHITPRSHLFHYD